MAQENLEIIGDHIQALQDDVTNEKEAYDEKNTLRNLLQHFSFYDFIIVDTKQNILFQYNSNDDWFHNLISLKKFYNQEVITVYKKENHFYISIDF